jgi:hypothetical protein
VVVVSHITVSHKPNGLDIVIIRSFSSLISL